MKNAAEKSRAITAINSIRSSFPIIGRYFMKYDTALEIPEKSGTNVTDLAV
jgi:hypothetical protein